MKFNYTDKSFCVRKKVDAYISSVTTLNLKALCICVALNYCHDTEILLCYNVQITSTIEQ